MAPEHTFVQISDIHLRTQGLLDGVIDCHERLYEALDHLMTSGIRPAAIILSGDLADEGEPEVYATIKDVVTPVADALGAKLIALPGNHDLPENMSGLWNGDEVHVVAGWRIIAMDSTIPGKASGELSAEQLDWLRAQLEQPGPALLAIHHPPLPSWTEFMQLLALRNPDALEDVLDGSDVRLIIAGHTHQIAAALVGGAPVWNAPALSYCFDSAPPHGRLRTYVDGGISRIDVFAGRPVATYVPILHQPVVGYQRGAVAMTEALRKFEAS